MSIIQKIRDKYAAVAIATIAIAMVGFILIDALSQRTGGGVFGHNTTDVGKVNGETITRVEFDGLIKRAEDNFSKQGQGQITEQTRGQINNTLWDNVVDQKIMEQQTDDLGLTFTKKELESLLYGPNPPELLRERFTDPKTGQYMADEVRRRVQQLMHLPAGDPQRVDWEDYINNKVIKDALKYKYIIMLMGATYYPKWLAGKDNQDNSAMANISYVDVPYALIPDSSIRVSDGEIDDYVQAHKGEFKTDEPSRDINYVLFSGDPSPKDSAAALSQLVAMRAGFVEAKDASAYLNQNGSSIPYTDQYYTRESLQVPDKDSIMALPVGGVFGPFLYNGAGGADRGSSYVFAKMIDKKDLPDSVRARHILVATIDPNSGQQVLDDSTAKRKIDSIQNLVAHGANWDSLAVKLSDDHGSAVKGGDLGFFPRTGDHAMVPEFSDFAFNGKKGERKIVKTVYGYHLIEILDQKNFQPNYKLAYLGKDIQPSDETQNAANVAATSFSADAQGGLSFEDAARKHHVALRTATLHESDYQVQGILGPARRLVQWTFENKKGDIGEPEEYGNEFIVTMIMAIHDAGLPSGSYARQLVENSVRRDKKAKAIAGKVGQIQDLSAAAASYNQTVQHSDSVHFASMGVQNLGNEPKVVGAAFFKGNLNKVSAPIQGNSGVFYLKTEGLVSLPNQNNDYTFQRQNMEGMMRQSIGQSSPLGLREAATIKDYRIKFY